MLKAKITDLGKGIAGQTPAEKSLSISGKDLSEILSKNADGIIVVDKEGTVLYVNPAAEKLFDRKKNNFLGLPFGYPISADKVQEIIVNKKDGTILELELCTVPVHWKQRNAFQLSVREIANRKRHAEKQFRKFFEEDLTGNVITDPGGNILLANPVAASLLGFNSVEELMEHKISEFYPAKDFRADFLDKIRHSKKLKSFETEMLRIDGRVINVIENVIGEFNDDGNLVEIKSYIFDNTDRKRAESELININRVYSVISHINKMILRTSDQETLFYETCRITIEHGKFNMAWIGLLNEKEQVVEPVVWHGVEKGYLANLKLSVTGVHDGLEPTGKAIRTGKYFYCNDIANDSKMTPWRDEALKRGYRASIAFPINVYGKIIGVFTIYSSIPFFFNELEISLLDEVAGDISYALEMIENKKQNTKTEKNLKLSESRYRRLFESAKDGILILDAENGMIVDVNPFLLHLLNYGFEELIGKELWEIGIFKNVAASKEAFIELQSKKYIRYEDLPLETREGKRINVEFISNVYLADNKKVIQCNIRDISARKLAEESLAREHNLLKTLIDNLPDYIYVKDNQGRFLMCNAAVLNQFRLNVLDDIIGKTDFDFFPKELADRFRKEEEKIIKSGHALVNQEGITMDNGTEKWISTIKVPLHDNTGSIIGFVGLGRDITEQKQVTDKIQNLNIELEQRINERTTQLEFANKELESFSYSVSHDLRAPLRSIGGYINILKNEYNDKIDDEGKRVIEIVIKNQIRMGQLIDDLLEFSRLSRNQLSSSSINMQTLTQDIVNELTSQPTDQKLNINIKLLPSCNGDISMIRQVWVNLLSNAIKYSRKKEHSDIELGSYAENGENIYYVRDNGTGFDMKYVDKLFNVFQRLHGSDEFEGTGVGLALVKRIITRHGGRVWAEGKSDEGATFYFSLPNNS